MKNLASTFLAIFLGCFSTLATDAARVRAQDNSPGTGKITEVSITRRDSGLFRGGKQFTNYTVILRSDNTAEYIGAPNNRPGGKKRVGRFQGKVDFAAIAEYIGNSDFFKLQDKYGENKDPGELTVTVVRDGVRKSVTTIDPGTEDPREFQAVYLYLDERISSIDFKKKRGWWPF